MGYVCLLVNLFLSQNYWNIFLRSLDIFPLTLVKHCQNNLQCVLFVMRIAKNSSNNKPAFGTSTSYPQGPTNLKSFFLISSSIPTISKYFFKFFLCWVQYDHTGITSQIANDGISLVNTIRNAQEFLFTMNPHCEMCLTSYCTWLTFYPSTNFLRILSISKAILYQRRLYFSWTCPQ